MYCSSCSGVVAVGLKYCNHCGKRLNGAKRESDAKPTELFPDSLVWAMVSVFVIGLGCILGLMAVMKNELNFGPGLIIAFSLMSFLLMFGVEGVLVWLLLQRKKAAKEVDNSEYLTEKSTKQLDESPARMLSEPTPSVTEQPTRTFEPIYNERKTK